MEITPGLRDEVVALVARFVGTVVAVVLARESLDLAFCGLSILTGYRVCWVRGREDRNHQHPTKAADFLTYEDFFQRRIAHLPRHAEAI